MNRTPAYVTASVTALVAGTALVLTAAAEPSSLNGYIVQAGTTQQAHEHLARIGAVGGRELDIIHAVGVQLTDQQAARLRRDPDVSVHVDRAVRTRGTLLSSLKKTLESVTNSVNSTVAGSAVGSTTTVASNEVIQPVLSTSLVSSVTSPLVTSA
ncbi:MAG TPA: hypothetical protein VEQ17_12375, partial [Steroidobacteraceae bacterium]|nr:hypothetical protein [Steroidobacteraceae bacterium]